MARTINLNGETISLRSDDLRQDGCRDGNRLYFIEFQSQPCVLKESDLKGNQKRKKWFERQCEFLHDQANCSYLAPAIASTIEDGCGYLLMPRYDLSLEDWLTQQHTDYDKWTVFRQLVEAVSYLESTAFFHRDLKPGNVMLDATGTIKIIDFEMLGKQELHQSVSGNGNYGTIYINVPPEIVLNESKTAPRTVYDAFGVGIILTLMFQPMERNQNSFHQSIIKDTYRGNISSFWIYHQEQSKKSTPNFKYSWADLAHLRAWWSAPKVDFHTSNGETDDAFEVLFLGLTRFFPQARVNCSDLRGLESKSTWKEQYSDVSWCAENAVKAYRAIEAHFGFAEPILDEIDDSSDDADPFVPRYTFPEYKRDHLHLFFIVPPLESPEMLSVYYRLISKYLEKACTTADYTVEFYVHAISKRSSDTPCYDSGISTYIQAKLARITSYMEGWHENGFNERDADALRDADDLYEMMVQACPDKKCCCPIDLSGSEPGESAILAHLRELQSLRQAIQFDETLSAPGMPQGEVVSRRVVYQKADPAIWKTDSIDASST